MRTRLDGTAGATTSPTMQVYRFYFISTHKSIIGVPDRHGCADDAAALLHAAELVTKKPPRAVALEIWDGRRLVGRVPVAHSNGQVPSTSNIS